MSDYAELIALTRQYLGIKQIVILAHEEKPQEFELLRRLGQALSEKVGPTRVVFDAESVGNPNLLIVTPNSAPLAPKATAYAIEDLDLYIRDPAKKRELWNDITALL